MIFYIKDGPIVHELPMLFTNCMNRKCCLPTAWTAYVVYQLHELPMLLTNWSMAFVIIQLHELHMLYTNRMNYLCFLPTAWTAYFVY